MSSILRCPLKPCWSLQPRLNARRRWKPTTSSASASLSSESRENVAESYVPHRTASQEKSARHTNDLQGAPQTDIRHRAPPLSRRGGEEREAPEIARNRTSEDSASATQPLRDVDVDLPPLRGRDVNEHFVEIAKQQMEPYLSLARSLVDATLPQMPKKWHFEPGWTKYDGNIGTSVLYPEDDALVLDVEVCVRDSERPVIATAVSPQSWYSWVSERLSPHEDYDVSVQGRRATIENLIPLESGPGSSEPGGGGGGRWRERLVVGHNVSYDRARIKEQYLLKGPRTKFLDTMSLHVCVAGQTASQKMIWQKYNKSKRAMSGAIPTSDGWLSVSSPNGLENVHWLHVGSRNGTPRIDKEKRDVFVKDEYRMSGNNSSLMRYCASDVFHTHEVLCAVLPLFLQHCPHPVTLAGMLEMGGAYMPVDESWEKYIADCEYTYEEMEGEMKAKLMALADDACSYMHGKRYLKSPWLCNLDWSSKKFRGKAKKTDMKRLLEQIEKHYDERDKEFRAGGSVEGGGGKEEGKREGGKEGEREGGKEGEKEGGKEGEREGESGGRTEFFISGDGPTKRAVHMPGYPEWYRNLCMRRSSEQWCPGAVLVSAQTRVAPYLLRMKWKGFPLHYHDHLGWGYIVPPDLRPGAVLEWDEEDNVGVQVVGSAETSDHQINDVIMDHNEDGEGALFGIDIAAGVDKLQESYSETREAELAPPTDNVASTTGGEVKEVWRAERVNTDFGVTDDVVTLRNRQTYFFFKLPHKDGAELNVGNPLAKSFLHQMETEVMTSAAGHLGRRILTLNSMMSFWRSARQRIMEQFVVWEDEDDSENETSVRRGVILPQLVVAGTVTRRAVEPTWLTASNAKETRVGSELKVMVRAPHGHHFVGADVDSQELWIAAILGDTHSAGMHGSTAVGWMTLQGSKSEGTDVHSKTASTIGITRDQAKVLNYGRFYGAGRPFIELLLKQFNPKLTGREVEEKARTLLRATKGRRLYKLKEEGRKLLACYGGVGSVAQDLISADDPSVKSMKWLYKYTEGRIWEGGSESDLFNKLESVALSTQPITPVLGCAISRALGTRNSYFPSKVNWVVQSSAVDYLHLMLVATKWLSDTYDIDGRYCISIHDEIRYLVRSEDRYRFALALQYANLLTRAMFSHRLGLQDLPMSVAFFSAVDVDKCLRKEPTMDCKTPSNPLGLKKGHNIPEGEVLDIYAVLEKTGGSLALA